MGGQVANPEERPGGWVDEVVDIVRRFVPRLLEDDNREVRGQHGGPLGARATRWSVRCEGNTRVR